MVVVIDPNGIIKMATCRHLGNTSIIIMECMAIRDSILVAKNNGFLNLEIKLTQNVTPQIPGCPADHRQLVEYLCLIS